MQSCNTLAPRARALWALAGVLCLTACGDSIRVLGPNPGSALAHADALFGGLAARFTGVEIAPRYAAARTRLGQSALVPSRLFDDTSIWSARPSPTVRVLEISGDAAEGRFTLQPRLSLSPMRASGETRHVITLTKVSGPIYRWDTTVEYAMGSVSAPEFAALVEAVLASARTRPERDARADYRAAFPRAAAAWGRGFSLDSLIVTPSAAGSASVTASFAFHPERLRAVMPAFSDYLDKYLSSAQYRLELEDRNAAGMFEIVGRNRMITFRYRVQDGHVVSLFGPPRPLPDTLVLKADVTEKVKMFTVGFHNLILDFLILRGDHERGWSLAGHREPDWNLPLVTARLLRTPLRHPFEPPGTLFQMIVRDSADAQTILTRRTRLEVEESPIMKFVGSLASHALRDLDERVQNEEFRFFREGFLALQADVDAMAPSWKGDKDENTNATRP